MWAAITFLYASAIIFTAVFLFVLVGNFEPNPRLAALFKAAIIVAAATTSPITYCPADCSPPLRSDGCGSSNSHRICEAAPGLRSRIYFGGGASSQTHPDATTNRVCRYGFKHHISTHAQFYLQPYSP